MKYINYLETPIGAIGLVQEEGYITEIFFGREDRFKDYSQEETPLLMKSKGQLEEYFAGKRKVFDLPLMPEGTDFQKAVWKALLDIPYGETRSYKEVAEAVGNPKAARAVGMANNKNPISIVIP